jgi:histidyl-tRNA synthetase
MKYTSQRGTRDILPEEIRTWQFLEEKAGSVFQSYNYFEIRTPIFEQTELFARGIGENTDIVGKEMYTFTDKGERSITLRPEETAPVVRAAIENGLIKQGEIIKLYYIGPMFRYERPQAGRSRQFHQAGVEVLGSADPLIDVEVIELGLRYFVEIGLTGLEVDINSVGCLKCMPKFKEELKKYFKGKSDEICETCRGRIEKNPLRILDCKEPGCQKAIEGAPSSADHLCEECKTHFDKVKKYLTEYGIKYNLNKRLVRGLDYYTKTTFEIISKALGAQNAVCGGGRYDGLIEELGGKPAPAVGFAIGLDRLVLLLNEQKIDVPQRERLQVYVITLGDAARQKGYEVLRSLRNMGISSDMDYMGKSLNSQLKSADRLKARFAIIIGDDELKNNIAIIRSMDNKTQENAKFEEILKKVS